MHRILILIVLFYTSSIYAQENDYVLISETDELIEYYRPNYPYEQISFHRFMAMGPLPFTSETGVLDGVFLEVKLFPKIFDSYLDEVEDSIFLNYSDFTRDEEGNLYSNFWFRINYFSHNSTFEKEKFTRPKNKTVNVYDKYYQLNAQYIYKDSLLVLYKSFTNNSIKKSRKIIDDKIIYSYLEEDGSKTITVTDSISQKIIHYYPNGKLKNRFNSNVLDKRKIHYSYDEKGSLKFIKTVYDNKKIVFETEYFKYIILPNKEGRIFSIQKVNIYTGNAKTPYIFE